MDRQIKHNLTDQPGYDRGMTDKPFLTIGEVADILQVSSRTVYNLIYKGTLRACRLTYHNHHQGGFLSDDYRDNSCPPLKTDMSLLSHKFNSFFASQVFNVKSENKHVRQTFF